MKKKYIQPKSREIKVRTIPLLSGSNTETDPPATPMSLDYGGASTDAVGEAKSIFGTTFSDENVWGEMW